MGLEIKINKAAALQEKGLFDEAEKIYLTILKKKPKMFDANQMLALCYHQQGRLTESISQYQKSLRINNHHAASHSNMGNVYMDMKEYKLAENEYKKALKLSSSANAYNNIANCYQKLHQHEKSLTAYQKAITLKPNDALFQENYGVALTHNGQFEKSLAALQLAHNLDPTSSSVYLHLFYLLTAMHMTDEAVNIAELCLSEGLLSKSKQCILHIGLAQICWLNGFMDSLDSHLKQSKEIMESHDELKDIAALRSFHKYLADLLPYRLSHSDEFDQETEKNLVMIAESHGFSPNATCVQFNGDTYKIKSFLVTGGKAWHMAQPGNNVHKASVQILFDRLPLGCKVIMGFGEIDCRANEGIFHNYTTRGIDFETEIPKMVSAYVSNLLEMAKNSNHELIFYGVPAPHPQMLDGLKGDDLTAFLRIIELFNISLGIACKEHNCVMLDIYSLTKTSSDKQPAQSNLKWHFDKIHMHPRTFSVLFKDHLVS